jgi:hypothetical protein
VIGDLAKDEKGQAAFMRPLNATHYSVYLTIPFDGEKKSEFNYYLNPQISKTRGICSVDDIAGMWTIVFRGTDYPNLDFEITKDIVPARTTATTRWHIVTDSCPALIRMRAGRWGTTTAWPASIIRRVRHASTRERPIR